MRLDAHDLLEPIFELLSLFCRRLHARLSGLELERARALVALLRSPGSDPRRFARVEVAGRVHLVPVQGSVVVATLYDLGGGGLQIGARRLPAPGSRALVHVLLPEGATRYTFPVLVAWTNGGDDRRAGLRFSDRPVRRDSTRTATAQPPASRRERPTVPQRPVPHGAVHSAAIAWS